MNWWIYAGGILILFTLAIIAKGVFIPRFVEEPYVQGNHLIIKRTYYFHDYKEVIVLGSDDWHEYIKLHTKLYVTHLNNRCLLQKERRGNNYYWYAYSWAVHGEKASRLYVGKLEEKTDAELAEYARKLGEITNKVRNRRKAEREARRKHRRAFYDRKRRSRAITGKS